MTGINDIEKQMARLNPEQKKAVDMTEGPVLIFAGAGSGKTMVIIHRIAKLLHDGVSPHRILAVTFTNKAAGEMRNRIKKLAGPEGMSVWMSTFHSLALKILKMDGDKDFTVYDEHDQIVAIKEALKRLKLDKKKFHPSWVREVISSTKNDLMDVESFKINAAAHEDSRRYTLGKIYETYQEILNKNSGYDFADLLVEVIKLLKGDKELLSKYRERFKYILVDEYQDTNYAQYVLIRLLSPPQDNICVVGDDDQCLVEGTKIRCSDRFVPIEHLKKTDITTGASGWGKCTSRKNDHISSRRYKGRVVRITTESGNELSVTPNHMLFAKIEPKRGLHYVYLMYKKNLGFRIGITQGVRSKRKSNNTVSGLMVRINQENADKIWVLRTCRNEKDARYYEQFYSVEYGLPTYTFHAKGRKLALDQKYINNLFSSINTKERAEKLMQDLLIDPRYPHVSAGGYVNDHIDRIILNFTLFGENRCAQENAWHAHRIQLNSSNPDVRKIIENMGIKTRKGRKRTWRVETSRKNYFDARQLEKQLVSSADVDTVNKARLTEGKSFLYQPASHIHESMIIPVYEDGRIVEDTVKEVVLDEYEGNVYDISVPDLRNYIADGIVVHNSIYSWRGADIRNILDFEKHYKDAKIFKLEENYRSTQNILEAAHNVIKNNESRKKKKLWTRKEKGERVKWQEFLTNREEALGVVSEIQRLTAEEDYVPSHMAIFYRVNAQSRSFEDALRNAGMNYRIIGGVRFYERKEIKDILAYMKVLVNTNDDISFTRIINTPARGIGDKTVENLKEIAIQKRCSLYNLVRHHPHLIPERIRKKLEKFSQLMHRLEEALEHDSPSILAKEIIEFSGYHKMLEKDDDIQARSRIENIEELVSAFAEEEDDGKGVREILGEISLLTDIDSWDENEDFVTLMTIHLAKGLEFPVAFLTGLEEELFPHYDALRDPAQMEEERRLCYVGMTRAKELLYLTAASQRMLYGQSRWHIPSRFVRESNVTEVEEDEYYYD